MTTSHLISIAGIAMSLLAGSGHHEGSANARAEEPQRPDASGNYATVNGLRMYYETRGEGEPLVLLHGAFGLAMDLPALAKNRRVIAVELQGHGHTADIERFAGVSSVRLNPSRCAAQSRAKTPTKNWRDTYASREPNQPN